MQNAQRVLLAFVLINIALPVYAKDITGHARIIDGDTISIGKTKIRLHGIDAPETKQTCFDHTNTPYMCGKASTASLRKLIGPSLMVHCKGKHHDRYKRLIAVCFTGGVDLNAEMVRQGWAMAYRKYSTDYVKAEVKAQKAKRGMWAGTFQMPWLWRISVQALYLDSRPIVPQGYIPTVPEGSLLYTGRDYSGRGNNTSGNRYEKLIREDRDLERSVIVPVLNGSMCKWLIRWKTRCQKT